MIGRVALRVGLLAMAFAVGTILVGWWGVPVVAVVWGVIANRTRSPGLTAATAAALAWAGLLGWTAIAGNLDSLAGILGEIMGVPGATLVVLTMLYPAAIAWAGARLASGATILLRIRAQA